MTYCICGASLTLHPGGGRQKHYCSDRCRQQAKRDRHTAKRDVSSLLNTITTGDARELAKSIPDNSVDLIFCDPPYLRENIEAGIYEWLAQEAERVLKPGGFCIAYCGTYWLAEAMRQMNQHLTFFWEYRILFRGSAGLHYGRRTRPGCTPLLAYCKGQGLPCHMAMDVYTGAGSDKAFHKWGQDAYSVQYYLWCFSQPKTVIWDPFTGGGTVPWVCKQIERDFIAFEIDPIQADIARKRIETMQPMLFAEKAMQAEMEMPA